MITSNVTTLTLDGGETTVEFEQGYPYIFITNKSDTDMYASLSPDVTAKSEGVYTIAAGAAERIGMGYPIKNFYIIGTGEAYIRGERIAALPSFKRGGKGGEKKSISAEMGYISDGLMCHYSADSNHFQAGWRIDDLSGNGNAGMFFVSGSYGSFGQPVFLTNAENYINLNNRYIIMPQMDYKNVTLEVVCKLQDTSSDEADIISNLQAGGYCILYNNNNKQIYPLFRIDGAYRNTAEKTNDYLVHLFTATYDDNALKFYVDGVLTGKTEIIGSIDFPTDNTVLAINANPDGGNAPNSNLGIGTFNFYSARVYNRALSADEIAQNFSVDQSLFWI